MFSVCFALLSDTLVLSYFKSLLFVLCINHLSVVRLFLSITHRPLCISGRSATQRTTTACLLQEATGPTETPQPASPLLPPAWSVSPRWDHLESHRAPLCATNLHPTGVCGCVVFYSASSPLSLVWSWSNMSGFTRKCFVCWRWNILVQIAGWIARHDQVCS